MRVNCLVIIFFLFAGISASAQVTISGTIKDAATGKPLPAVSIYLNNSATGTITNSRGEYTLSRIDAQRFDLIVSCIGYQTISKPLSILNLPGHLDFKLTPVSTELTAIQVVADDKNGWLKWGQLFLDNLLGTGDGATQCKLLNRKVLKFIFDKGQEKLSVYASEPLVIDNKYLGYQLVYDLQFFKYDFKANAIFFLGYPLFKTMQGSDGQNKKWDRNRKYAYEGSMLHFMRALYRKSLDKDGFVMNVVTRKPNTDKLVQNKQMRSSSGEVMASLPDSTDYSGRTLLLLDSVDQYSNQPVEIDSVAFRLDTATVGLKFNGHIGVKYAKEKDMAQVDKFHAGYTKGRPSSIITLLGNAIYVYKNGTYYEPDNIFIEGYWSRIEKLSNLLPIDYGESQ